MSPVQPPPTSPPPYASPPPVGHLPPPPYASPPPVGHPPPPPYPVPPSARPRGGPPWPPFREPMPPTGVPAPGGRRRHKRVYRVGGTTSGTLPLTTEQLEAAIARVRELFQQAEQNADASGGAPGFPTTVTVTQTHEPLPIE